MLQVPFLTALYPFFSVYVKTNFQKAERYLNKIALLGSMMYLVLIGLIFYFAPEINTIVFGKGLDEIATLIRIMCIIPLFIFLNNLSGTQMLLNMGKDKVFFSVLMATAILNLVMVIPLTIKFGYTGTAISVVISEFALCVMMYAAYVKQRKEMLE